MEFKKRTQLTLPMGVLDLDVTPDQSQLYAATMGGTYRLTIDHNASEKVGEHQSWVSGVALFDDARRIVSAGYDGILQLRRLTQPRPEVEVQAHRFWSWKLAKCESKNLVASVSGQYLAGDERYTPRDDEEPNVKVFDANSGEQRFSSHLLPPVQSVALSNDGTRLAAANLMGDIAVWNLDSGHLEHQWRTEDFTSWGIIKSHCFIGGIHALSFTPDGQSLFAVGMGPMRDPMAGNGRQLWQQFQWSDQQEVKVRETEKKDAGEGLMETIAMHPSGEWFVMAGRLRGGEWNAAAFSCDSGERIGQLNTGIRITAAQFSNHGDRLYLGGMKGQPGPDKNGSWGEFGIVDCFDVAT